MPSVLTGIIIGFIAGQIVGVVAAAFLAAARGNDDEHHPRLADASPRRSRGTRFVLSLSRRGGRRSSGRSRVVA